MPSCSHLRCFPRRKQDLASVCRTDQAIRHPEMAVNPSRQHYQKYYYEIKHLGSGAFGDVYLAIDRQIADGLQAQSETMDRAELYNAMKAQLVAIKVSTRGRFRYVVETTGLSEEIHIITNVIPTGHSRIIEALDSCVSGDVRWLAMPYVTGGNLCDFADAFPDAMSLAFLWHVAYQTAEGLMFLYFGTGATSDTVEHGDWQCVSHGDLHSGNLFLRPSSTGYPDVVLADFGLAKYFHLQDETMPGHLEDDLGTLAGSLRELLEPVARSEPMTEPDVLLQWIGRLEIPVEEDATKNQLHCLLRDFVTVAGAECRRLYQSMPESALAALASSKVSDTELDAVFCRQETRCEAVME